jgi:hypothetical protein
MCLSAFLGLELECFYAVPVMSYFRCSLQYHSSQWPEKLHDEIQALEHIWHELISHGLCRNIAAH